MSRSSVEFKRIKEKRLVTATVGYCFVIVLVVLLVMSNILTSTYKQLLQKERAESIESLSMVASTALTGTSIEQGMSNPLPDYLFEYGNDKKYDLVIYSVQSDKLVECYPSAGSESHYKEKDIYGKCISQGEPGIAQYTFNGVDYICAASPIYSSDTLQPVGICELRIPVADYMASVNGMSLSWIFTIFSIAISMGIIIFEINLIVSTISKGITPNVPILIMYGENANRFLSFFTALGTIMPPVVMSLFIKEHLSGSSMSNVYMITALDIILYSLGIYCFSNIRKLLKFKLTSRIALVVVTTLGYMLCLIAGISNNVYVLSILTLPIAFCFGMPLDALRDYRILASRFGYKNFEDRKIHNLQLSSYFLGVSVGTVVAGICYERFGLLIVSILAGAILVFTALGITYFMKSSIPVKESFLPINKWLELVFDKYTGRFLISTFTLMGVVIAFFISFVPQFMDTVGISLATTSFYYLLGAFSACYLASIIKDRYSGILTSKVRVMISTTSTLIGFAIFALMPTAKMLCIAIIFLGISLGIHDFYYLYVLYLLSHNRIKANLRKACELSLIMGFVLGTVVFASALITNNIRIVFLAGLVILFLCGYIYPMSSFSNMVDDKDPTLLKRPNKNKSKKKSSNNSAKKHNANAMVNNTTDMNNYSSDNQYYPQESVNHQYDNNQYYQEPMNQQYDNSQYYQEPVNQQYDNSQYYQDNSYYSDSTQYYQNDYVQGDNGDGYVE